MLFMQQSRREMCILSASGSISNASLRQPATSGGSITYEVKYWSLFFIISFCYILIAIPLIFCKYLYLVPNPFSGYFPSLSWLVFGTHWVQIRSSSLPGIFFLSATFSVTGNYFSTSDYQF